MRVKIVYAHAVEAVGVLQQLGQPSGAGGIGRGVRGDDRVHCLIADGVSLDARHGYFQILALKPGYAPQLQRRAQAVGIVQPVALAAGVVIGAHQHQQARVGAAETVCHGAEGAVHHGALYMAYPVDMAHIQHLGFQRVQGDKQHIPIEGVFQRGDERGVLAPFVGVDQTQKDTFAGGHSHYLRMAGQGGVMHK